MSNLPMQLIVMVLLALIWGSSFILMKRGLESFSPLQVGSMRVFFTFLFLLPFGFKQIKKISKKNVVDLLIVGFLGNLFPALLFAQAQVYVSSSLAGMLNSIVPIFSLLAGLLFFSIKIKPSTAVGVAIGFVGAAGLIYFGAGKDSQTENAVYALLIVLATIFYALSLNQIKYKLSSLRGPAITVIAFMITGPVAAVFLAVSDFGPALASPGFNENLIYVILLALFSSTIAVPLFYALVDHANPIFASSVTYIIPIVAIGWGMADGETITVMQGVLMAVILAGIYLIGKKDKKTAEAVPVSVPVPEEVAQN